MATTGPTTAASSSIEKQAAVAQTRSGQAIDAYTLTAGAYSMRVLNLAGAIEWLKVPNNKGESTDVVLGYANPAQYERNGSFFGALIGRVANRIANAKYTLDGKEFKTDANNGAHTLHGGTNGYDKRIWTITPREGESPALELTLHDPAGHGFDGDVDVKVIYTLDSKGVLSLDYEATTTAPTPINLTQHTYFNLKDAGATTVEQHHIQLDCHKWTPADATAIPTGEIQDVKGTRADLTSEEEMGAAIKAMGGTPVGIDHNFVIDGEPGTLRRAARVSELTTGRSMECWTTQPGLQFYTGIFLDGRARGGKDGHTYPQYSGFCLETQGFPNAINEPNFPSTVLRPGETFRSRTEYRFAVR